jgi:wobble nucleotide-excising tRNase
MNHEIEQLFQEIEQYKFQLDTEMDGLSYYDASLKRLQSEENKARNCLIKLKEAQKFSDYKYTASDVQLYEDAKKTWDNFAGWYIQEWLDNLTFIINDLLKDMDMSVSFSADKTFITITNEGQEMDYESLSSGQQTFLNVIFKLAVLLNNGINEGVVMLDEMINTLNFNSLNKLLIILKTLNFQFFLIYQNIPENIEDVNYINIERKNGESTIK